jgi:hypothetical protein
LKSTQLLEDIMILQKRIQLTLFIANIVEVVPHLDNVLVNIETIRQKFNTIQYELIKAHITLCREDELEDIETVIFNLKNLDQPNITVEFGKPIRFSDGKGVMIPALGENSSFQNLRKVILQNSIENPRKHEPHITLMHPRNATCTDVIFEQIKKKELPSSLTFCKVSLIEQINGGQWTVLSEFDLISK